MLTYSFRVPAVMGYQKSVAYSHSRAYKSFKFAVRALANSAGVPDLCTTDTEIDVEIFWKKKAKIDGSNVLKAVEDALFAQDRHLARGSWMRFLEQGCEPYLIVSVRW